MAANSGVVQIHGRNYKTVAMRVNEFRNEYPFWPIRTKLIMQDDERVIMRATICTDMGVVVATGYAEEVRASSTINRTSALENAETSAIGRALAAFGLAGTEYASADELTGALKQQSAQEHLDYMVAVREFWPTIGAVKSFLAEEVPNIDAAREAYKELTEDEQKILWRAPTKGGVFTTEERKLLKEGLPQ